MPEACRRSTSSACRTPRSRNRAIACAPRCRTRSSSFPHARSPSTSRRRICPRSPAGSICRSRSASSPRRGRFRRDALAQYEFAGELALGGALRPIRGALPMALSARRDGRAFVLPAASAAEAALVHDAVIYPGAVAARRVRASHGARAAGAARARSRACRSEARAVPDLADVRGQAHAKRALTIAAAGAHSLLMIGPPGTGKSMLAQRLPGILPPLAEDEALAAAAIASLAGRFSLSAWGVAAVSRAAPHGKRGRAGRRRQRSAARRDLARAPRRPVPRRAAGVGSPRARSAARAARVRRDPHLARRAAEHLSRRVPVRRRDESLSLRLARPRERALSLHAGRRSRAIAAACPGPLLDRIDLGIEVPALAAEALAVGANAAGSPRAGHTSAGVRAIVTAARARQIGRQGKPNARLDAARDRGPLPAGRDRRGAARAGDGAAFALGAGVSPDPQGGADDRRPGGSPVSRRRMSPRRSPTDVSIACEKGSAGGKRPLRSFRSHAAGPAWTRSGQCPLQSDVPEPCRTPDCC